MEIEIEIVYLMLLMLQIYLHVVKLTMHFEIVLLFIKCDLFLKTLLPPAPETYTSHSASTPVGASELQDALSIQD